ncbi:MAG: RnfABCDGE type electron transport complex subunit G [Candidatus Omnitrophota bacterium]
MRTMARYGITLGFICILAAGLLAGVNALTRPMIFAQAKQQEEKALSEVFHDAGRFEEIKSAAGEIIYYKVYDNNGVVVGVAFKATGKGYSGPVETMVGMDMDGKIGIIKVLSQNETPGLGSRVSEGSFTSQFSGKNIAGLDEVQAITGATISSKAVTDPVKNKAQEILSLIKNER